MKKLDYAGSGDENLSVLQAITSRYTSSNSPTPFLPNLRELVWRTSQDIPWIFVNLHMLAGPLLTKFHASFDAQSSEELYTPEARKALLTYPELFPSLEHFNIYDELLSHEEQTTLSINSVYSVIFSQLSHLRAVAISQLRLSQDVLHHLSTLPHLAELAVEEVALHPALLQRNPLFPTFPSLQILNLGRTSDLSDTSASAPPHSFLPCGRSYKSQAASHLNPTELCRDLCAR